MKIVAERARAVMHDDGLKFFFLQLDLYKRSFRLQECDKSRLVLTDNSH